ncbi:ribonuclease HII [Clostridiales Family XIII bacterium PM5-7]
MNKAEREQYLREKLHQMFGYERELYDQGLQLIAGVDEVGRGPLAGPVIAAAVVLPKDFDVLGVDDSKKLSEKKREQLYDEIIEKAIGYGIGIKDNLIIDQVNILEATKLAMIEAIEQVDDMLMTRLGKTTEYVLFDAMSIESINKPQQSLIKGDSKSVSIAAASIIAKVTRDRMMIDYDRVYPGYSFANNKGYGTKAHYEGIHSQGITPIHRKTFLKNLVGK